MTDRTIISGNIVIAEFIGATKGRNDKDGIFYYIPDRIPSYLPSEMKFNESFDWLMPVVLKIINLGWRFNLDSGTITNDASFKNTKIEIKSIAWSTPILATYNLVIDFINYYNSNIKTS